jgi:TetR/AcrR family transcriptional regulator, tetracycline repressor protein
MPTQRRRPWGSLNQEKIVSTALDLVRREGLDALSVRRLAAELGASRMALYRHVPNKQALVDLIGSRFTESELVPPEAREGPWQDRLRALAASIRRHLHAHPGLIDLLLRHGVTSPGRLALAEAILQTLTTWSSSTWCWAVRIAS